MLLYWHREAFPQRPEQWAVEWGDLGSFGKRGVRDPASRPGEGTEEHCQGADGRAQPQLGESFRIQWEHRPSTHVPQVPGAGEDGSSG
jgi:hypothetical protein